MDINPNTAAQRVPAKRLCHETAAAYPTSLIDLYSSATIAPAMMGMLIKKEKSAESSRGIPQNTPAASVVPLRESPGITANACAQPIANAFLAPIGR